MSCFAVLPNSKKEKSLFYIWFDFYYCDFVFFMSKHIVSNVPLMCTHTWQKKRILILKMSDTLCGGRAAEGEDRLCDAGSSLRLWCLASTLKSPWITDGYLVALQCCTSSAYISSFCCCCCWPLIGSWVPSSLDAKRSRLHCFLLHFVFRALDVDFCENRGKDQFPALHHTLYVW